MSSNTKPFWMETLPDPLPANPLELASEWLNQARIDAAQPNPDSVVLATVDGDGHPSARVVLCKEIAAHAGFIVFYTNYQSRKGRELGVTPGAAVVFHGTIATGRCTPRPRRAALRRRERRVLSDPALAEPHRGLGQPAKRAGAIASRTRQRVAAAAQRFGIPYGGPGTDEPEEVTAEVPRPSHWGGYRLRVDSIELWVEGEFRIHDRARWTRTAHLRQDVDAAMTWTVTRLQP